MEKYLTSEQVASLLQVHPFTVLKYLKEGKLPGVKIGRMYRIKECDVESFLEEVTLPRSKTEQTPSKKKTKKEPKPEKEHKIEEETKEKSKEEYFLI